MQIKWIEDFLSLTATKAFSRAADARHISQPTLSRHIQALEDWLGVALIDRRVQGVCLTPAGRLFRSFATDMLRRTYEMRTLLRGHGAQPGEMVRFSVAHTLAHTFFPDWLKQLKDTLGPVRARVSAINIQEGASTLTEGATDLLLIYHHPQLPVLLDPERFPHLLLATEQMQPVSAPDAQGRPRHQLPGRPEAPSPLLAYSAGTYLAHVVEMILLGAGQTCHFERSFDTHMAEALKAMIIAGHGLGWLPERCIGNAIDEGRLVSAAPRGNWTCTLEVRLYRAADNDSPCVDQLWAHLLAQGRVPPGQP